ncbi:MAG: hypothetical protein QW735_01100 [archaeon]
MNGTFELIHKVDEELLEVGYKHFNPIALELTKICVEYNKDPEEVVEIYKKILKKLL